MKTNTTLRLLALTALSAGSILSSALPASAQARSLGLAAPAPGDLAAEGALERAVPLPEGMEVPREAASFSWPLDPARDLDSEVRAPRTASREYRLDVTAEELRAGVPLLTTAPGAVVRVNPVARPGAAAHAAVLDPASFTLVDGRGRSLVGAEALEQMATAEQLEAAGMPFAEGTAAFRLKSDLGTGRFTLQAAELAAEAGGAYSVHVFEPASDTVLSLSASRASYLHGDTLTVEAALARSGVPQALDTVRGLVASPAGRVFEVDFAAVGGGLYRAALELDASEALVPGLWEAHASVSAGSGQAAVLRAGKLPFAVARATARLSGEAQVSAARSVAGRSLTVEVGVEAGSAGRYEVRGVLWAADREGALRPAGTAHAAALLEPGAGFLALRFDEASLRDLEAPYEVRDLTLVDQGRMGLLHRQARGLVID